MIRYYLPMFHFGSVNPPYRYRTHGLLMVRSEMRDGCNRCHNDSLQTRGSLPQRQSAEEW